MINPIVDSPAGPWSGVLSGFFILGPSPIGSQGADLQMVEESQERVIAPLARKDSQDVTQVRGPHVDRGGLRPGRPRRPRGSASQTVQLFTKNNNQWKAPSLTDAHIAAFRTALAETGIVDPVAHNSYLINLASPDDALWSKSIDAMTIEVERCQALGISRSGHPSRGARRLRRGGGPGAGRRGGSTRSTAGPGASPSGSTWRRPPVRARASGTGSSTSAGSSSESPSPSGWASVPTPAIFSRRAIPSRRTKSTMRRSMNWTGPSAWTGSGSGISTTAAASAGAGSIATPGSAGVTWAGAVPSDRQRLSLPSRSR